MVEASIVPQHFAKKTATRKPETVRRQVQGLGHGDKGSIFFSVKIGKKWRFRQKMAIST
jgi:hypothetical protein